MPKTRAQKEAQLTQLIDTLQTNQAVVLTEFSGLTMEDLTNLRTRARKEGISFQIAKNTLLDKAAQAAGIEGLAVKKIGKQIAIAAKNDDEAAISKLIYQFVQDKGEKVKIYSGILGRKIVPVDIIIQLAQLPSREELLTKLVGSLNSPISGLVRVLNGPLQGFYNCVKALSNK